METSVSTRGPALDLACIGLSDTLIEIATSEASQLLKAVLGGAHAPHDMVSRPNARSCNMDPLAETLALFNANWRGAAE